MQIFNMKLYEAKNFITENPKKVAELKAALEKNILDGRNTVGKVQKNE